MRLPLFLCVAAAVPGLIDTASAAVIADYQFTGGSLSSSAASGIATASNMSLPQGGIVASQFIIYNTSNLIPESLSLSITGNFYLSLTVSPTVENLAISSLTFNFGMANNTSTVNPYTGNWAVFSSVGGFAEGSQIQTGNFSLPSGSGAAGIFANPAPNISLTSVAGLQNVSSPTEFRIYYWDNASVGSSNLNLRIDAVQLNATTVPEPSSLLLMALAAAVGLWCRRNVSDGQTKAGMRTIPLPVE